jgi:glycosyltransferase involved in cell wall biosynthesis
MHPAPDITVILAVYNGGQYLAQAVSSVLTQHFKNFELLVLDDCSADGSWEYLESLNDRRVCLFRNESNKGLFHNLNYLLRKSRAPLIKLWSQDDIMYPHCLQSVVNFHQRHRDLGFSYSSVDRIDEAGNIKKDDHTDKTPEIISTDLHAIIAYYTGSIAGNIANVCISKTALNEAGFFNEDMKISGDFDMWVRLAKNHDTGFINQKLIQLRDHKNQLSRNEKYYINHVMEDASVYRYLDSYVDGSVRKKGRKLLRRHKLMYYYTLMLQSLLKGDLSNCRRYLKVLLAFDNIFVLTTCYISTRINKPAPPEFFN